MRTKQTSTQHGSADLIGLIGYRVRSLRALRRMTRKSLVAESAVSERHLAQLEMGRGNISIALLERVARALDTDLGDLVRDGQHESIEQILIQDHIRSLPIAELKTVLTWLQTHYAGEAGKRQRVALVGLRGAGKSTLGKRLAEERKVPFVRLVAEVEKLAGMSASVIFEMSGQSGYRRLEEKALTETLSNYHDCVIEAGGSIVAQPELFNLLLSSCTVVWVRALPEQHMQRVIDQGDMRPMAGNDNAMSDLIRILKEREPYYVRAHHILDTSDRAVAECAQELANITQLTQITD